MDQTLIDRMKRLRPMSAEQFADLEIDEPCELVRGKVVVMPRPRRPHGAVVAELIRLIGNFVRSRKLGRVLADSGFVTQRDPDTVRGPDISFLSAILDSKALNSAFIEGSPTIAIEVLSPSNTKREMNAKVREYLASGSKQVWIVDPEARTVTVHTKPRHERVLTEDDTLDGGAELPGFEVDVSAIFE